MTFQCKIPIEVLREIDFYYHTKTPELSFEYNTDQIISYEYNMALFNTMYSTL